MRVATLRCRKILFSRVPDSPNSKLAAIVGPSFRWASVFSSLRKRFRKIPKHWRIAASCLPASWSRNAVAAASQPPLLSLDAINQIMRVLAFDAAIQSEGF